MEVAALDINVQDKRNSGNVSYYSAQFVKAGSAG